MMNYVQLLIYWQCFYAWLGLRYVNHVHYSLCWGKCKFCLVLECSYVIYIYIYVLYILLERRHGGTEDVFLKCV